MSGMLGGEYRDETRIVPMLLPMFRKLVAALPPVPDKPGNIGDFM